MPQNAIIVRHTKEFLGIDARSNDIRRETRYGRNSRNIEPLRNGSIGLRAGSKAVGPASPGVGCATYIHRDTNGLPIEERIVFDSLPKRVLTGSFTITYGGDGDIPVFQILAAESDGFLCKLLVDDVEEASIDLGTGINETTPYTIADLISAIDDEDDFACTLVSGDDTIPAAFLAQQQGADIGSGLTVEFLYYEDLFCPTANPFSTAVTKALAGELDLFSTLNTNEVLYIATGANKLYKYDYESLYAAGMPEPAAISGSVYAASGITGAYFWFVTYTFIDARGNVIESVASNVLEFTLAADSLDITIPNIQADSEFLTSCAYANNGGIETGTTLTVDNNTLQVGQTAFFRDNAGAEVEDVITGRTATSITFANSYTIANNAVISANLRVNLYRNKAGGSTYYLVKRFANDSLNATFTFRDDVADSAMTEDYDVPLGDGHGEPPANLRFLAAYQGLIIGANASDLVYRSDLDGPEYWNVTTPLLSKSNRPVRAIAASQQIIFIFKQDEIHGIVGDLASGSLRQEIIASGYGCDSHHSIVSLGDAFWFYSKDFGVGRLTGASVPDEASFRIAPLFNSEKIIGGPSINHSRVVGVAIPGTSLAAWFFPITEVVNGAEVPTNDSFVAVADHSKQSDYDVEYDEAGRAISQSPKINWWIHDSLNMMGGAFEYDGELFWMARADNSGTSTTEAPLFKRIIETSAANFHDHSAPIAWGYEHGWDDMGMPEVDKKFVKAMLFSLPEAVLSEFSLTADLERNWINGVRVSRKEITLGRGAGSGGYGDEPWGEFDWGSIVIPSSIFPFIPTRAKAVKLKFSGVAFQERPVISSWAVEASPAYEVKIKTNG